MEPLPILLRGYIYAVHVSFLEILFTVLILGHEWTFRWASVLGSFLLYGACALTLEQIHLALRGDCCLLTRSTLYTFCIFFWQFCVGYFLRLFGACPWDFSNFHYNFMGLIALEHSLIWFVSALMLERMVIRNTLRLRVDKPWKPDKDPKARPLFELKDD
ncbi:transmembrane protein 229B-like [Anolis sagrei]|uniref:transmembrane protein 229B-like n=1 Tax=Anolis sagrei TaxID=38937 RepID=UPI0035230C1D